MRLRPRNSSAATAAGNSAAVTSGAHPARSVLGDVSNKRSAPSDGTKPGGQKAAKRAKKTADAALSGATGNIESDSTRATGRRSSARLRKKSLGKTKKTRQSSRSDEEERKTVIDVDAESRDDASERELKVPEDDAVLRLSEFRLQRRDFDGTNHTLGFAPFDVKNKDDPLQVAKYVTDLFQHLYKAETESAPGAYMDRQQDVNAKMRAILVDWLVEVHMKFRLVPETLYLCVNIIDRYCNRAPVARSKLQLVGVTALLIACKYEEIYPPEVRDCVYITDRAYDRQEVLDMEQDILDCLHFKMTVPTAYPFLLRFLNITKATTLTRYAAHYYMERTLQEHELLDFRPSLVCAASVVLALNNPDVKREERSSDNPDIRREARARDRQLPGMPTALLDYTSFDPAEILRCAKIIADKVAEEPVTASRRQLIAVKRKYDNKKYMFVSTVVSVPNYLDIVRNTANFYDSCSD